MMFGSKHHQDFSITGYDMLMFGYIPFVLFETVAAMNVFASTGQWKVEIPLEITEHREIEFCYLRTTVPSCLSTRMNNLKEMLLMEFRDTVWFTLQFNGPAIAANNK